VSKEISLDPEMNPKCKECRSIDIDHDFKKTFGCLVCNKCKNDFPEKYSLLTKTECKEVCSQRGLVSRTAQRDFTGLPIDRLYVSILPVDCTRRFTTSTAELRDQEALPHLLKANPHKSTFANMMLYVRYQVEEFAWKKWGSPEALDAEYERRMAIKKKTKNRKFEESLRDLRRRTRETVWQKRQDAEHKHVYGPVENGSQVCHTCGFTIEVEEF
jgi:DNA-repair protein complementing XP-A cells